MVRFPDDVDILSFESFVRYPPRFRQIGTAVFLILHHGLGAKLQHSIDTTLGHDYGGVEG